MPKPKRKSGQLRLSNKYSIQKEKVAFEVPGILANATEDLKRIFPQVFVEGKVDFEKLRTTLGETIDKSPDRFTFSWAGRKDSIQILQMLTRSTLIPERSESLDFETTRNLFLEGDNLEILKLLRKPYFGKVKMIYIDPPYNTGNDFVYKDDYSDPLESYLRMTRQKSSEGDLLVPNPETSGRFHSAWLSMMYPRLFVARQLLMDEGMIFISIDDNEFAHLRIIMNEIFGEECFVGTLVWKRRQNVDSRAKTGLSGDHEYVMIYRKSPESRLRGQRRISRNTRTLITTLEVHG